jgi:hypothetical protein
MFGSWVNIVSLVQLGPEEVYSAMPVVYSEINEMGIRFTHPAPGYCGFHLSLAPAIVVW